MRYGFAAGAALDSELRQTTVRAGLRLRIYLSAASNLRPTPKLIPSAFVATRPFAAICLRASGIIISSLPLARQKGLS